ncbi:MAG TPA: methyltransferase domain-containing protein [Pyrinomonadaceae bacterium]|nr:methyltransferase domain-containing protein [Pyrinomonadaceae bacterium]
MHSSSELFKLLCCPRDLAPLEPGHSSLVCKEQGHVYPIIEGIPIMLVAERDPTNWNTPASIKLADEINAGTATVPYADWDGIGVHPHLQHIIASTNGNLYKYAINKLRRYPVPDLRLPKSNGELFLDIGCNWGRWSIAAAQKGYCVVGLDPNLDAIIAAKQIANQLGLQSQFVVGDARCLPFRSSTFDRVFSYSVIQHFSKQNGSAGDAIKEISRVLVNSGSCFIQMPNRNGIRSLYNHIRDRNSTGPFRVRYWTPAELYQAFETHVGETKLSADGYFGLGIQRSDTDLMPIHFKAVVYASEVARFVARVCPPVKYCADSLYVESRKGR